jgi:dienelactone hydrolase
MALNTGLTMAEIKTQEIEYSAGGINMKGYLAMDEGKEGKRPGVLVVHEWWGLNDYVRKRSEMLAELGYSAMAVDMFGDGKTADDPENALKYMNEVVNDLPALRERFNAALQTLRGHPGANPEKTAAIGYCMGGGVVLHMARLGADLKAVASFHGSLPLGVVPDAAGTKIKARVVAYNGEDDSFVPAEAISAFKNEMRQANADWQFINYPCALHGFSNPAATANGENFGLPLKYNALADQSSWDHMRLLLESVFRDRGPASQ